MGHSDSTPLRDLLSSEAAIASSAPEVQVWGDMSHFELPAAEAGASQAPHVMATARTSEDMYQRIGHLTRTLHDAMRELGYHEHLADARDNLPDARDRLAYISRLTGDAAEKVLNSVDRARALQDGLAQQALALQTRWASVAAYAAGGGRATPAGAALINETREFLGSLNKKTELTNAILTDIMMAQDFHDLTGQVIRKVVRLAQSLEEQLVKLLVEANAAEPRKQSGTERFEGPVVTGQGRSDVVVDQAGVDELLASLGF